MFEVLSPRQRSSTDSVLEFCRLLPMGLETPELGVGIAIISSSSSSSSWIACRFCMVPSIGFISMELTESFPMLGVSEARPLTKLELLGVAEGRYRLMEPIDIRLRVELDVIVVLVPPLEIPLVEKPGVFC